MKSSRIMLVSISVLLVVAMLFWWLGRPTSAEPDKTTTASKPTPPPTISASQSTPMMVVEAPKLPPASVPVADKVQKPVPAASTPATDPRVRELNTTIDNIERALESGDIRQFLEITMTPEELKGAGDMDQFVQQYKQQPDFQERVDLYLNGLPRLKDSTPVFNDAGDTATYILIDTPNSRTQIEFKKIDGRWYFNH